MARLLVLLGLFFGLCPLAQAQAQTPPSSIERFDWRVSGTFDLEVVFNGQPAAFRGTLREDGDTVDVTSKEKINARLTSYRMFVSIILSREGVDLGQLFLLERQNKDFAQLNDNPIYGRAVEMPKDLAYSLERFAALEKLDGKDPSFCFRTMVSYFEANPGKKLDQFADDVEKGVDVVKVVPKPTSRVASSGQSPATGPTVAPPRPQVARRESAPPPSSPDEIDSVDSPRPRVRAQQPQQPPWSQPRYVPRPPPDPYGQYPRAASDDGQPPRRRAYQQDTYPRDPNVPDWVYRQQLENQRRAQAARRTARDSYASDVDTYPYGARRAAPSGPPGPPGPPGYYQRPLPSPFDLFR